MNAQIYLVSNKLNGKQYVGQTINPDRQIGHGRILRKAYKLHGRDNFSYEPICTGITSRTTLNAVERFWIAVADTVVPKGYNIELGGSEGSTWTEERRRKHSLALKGHRGWRKGLNLPSPNKGKKYPEEGKRKLSEALKGRVSPNWGRKASEETKAKMTSSQKAYWAANGSPNKGRKHSEETKAKMSAARSKRVYTDEDKMKISQAVTEWHKNRKEQV
jgi:group I intron endonuclease